MIYWLRRCTEAGLGGRTSQTPAPVALSGMLHFRAVTLLWNISL